MGSRNDPAGAWGLSHFLEHTLFKGTRKRRSYHINRRMEAVGGDLNANTTKEFTTLIATAPRGNLGRSAELVSDLVRHSQFPEGEIAKEREVVCDEIDSYRDSPPDVAFDDFDDMIFGGTALGHNILGTRASVRRLTSEQCRGHLERYYRPERMCVFYSGPMGMEHVREVVEKYFGDMERGGEAITDVPTVDLGQPFAVERHGRAHQVNTVTGARVCAYGHEDCVALKLLADILGGPGLNSRLYTALREREGLVYGIDASVNLYSDAGTFVISYGCDPGDNGRCLELVWEELEKVCEGGLTARQLRGAQKQYAGQMIVGAESRAEVVMGHAQGLLLSGRVMTDAQWRERLMGLTAAEVMRVAERYLRAGRFSTLTVG